MNINPILLANVLIALTESLLVWDHNVRLGTTDCAGPRLIVVASFLLLMHRQAFQFYSVNGPVRIFTFKTTYFIFQGKFFEQVKGAAMGSPISPIVANLFMEDLEVKALSTAPTPPTLWKRFVDDTFIIIQRTSKESFLQHLNAIDDNIHFTVKSLMKMDP